MILIADSGSTKTEWREIEGGKAGRSYISSGINPFFVSSDEIVRLLGHELPEMKGVRVSRVYFYGTGVSSAAKADIVRGALSTFFGTGDLFIGSDLLGAARSLCQNEPGIACIIGTGSNSCYYEREKHRIKRLSSGLYTRRPRAEVQSSAGNWLPACLRNSCQE